jgi:hypothetical protein
MNEQMVRQIFRFLVIPAAFFAGVYTIDAVQAQPAATRPGPASQSAPS